MSEATEAILFNAAPLLLLAAVYAAVTVALLPSVWRSRDRAHPLELATVTVFPAIAFAAAVFGVLVLRDRQPFGGHVWPSFAAIVVAIVPALLFLARLGDRALVVGGARRASEAEARVSVRDRELAAVAALLVELAKASEAEGAAEPLVRHVASLLEVGFAGVALVDESLDEAIGLVARLEGKDLPWWRGLRVELREEPSGIASAVFDAAPVSVYDVESSPLVSRVLTERLGAKSGLWVPMIAGERVVGVLAVVALEEKRAFTRDEIALLQALAAESALTLGRLRSAEELAVALRREQLVAAIARRVRAELDSGEVMRVAARELSTALGLDRAAIELGPEPTGGIPLEGIPIEIAGERIGTFVVERVAPLAPGERFVAETAALEVGLALHTARLLAENRRRIEEQGALLHAAQVVTGELELEPVLQRLVEEMAKLLRADAADCYLFDRESGVLRCAAVHGLDPSLVGFEFDPSDGVAGLALQLERPVASDVDAVTGPVPNPAYEEFSRALVAPMVWAGEPRGVIGVGIRDPERTFDDGDVELLEAFASLASLALRNAESFAESTRQARVQRGFYRIASLLGEPLSLAQAYDAAAQAAAETLGGDWGAVLMPERGVLALLGAFELPDELRALPIPPALADAAAAGTMLTSAAVADDDRFEEAWHESRVASLLAIPVSGDGAGLVVVYFGDERAFSRDDLELARQLAQAARGALERSRLFEAERSARSLSQQLARTGSLLATELDPAAVFEEVVVQAQALLGVDAAALFLLVADELVVTAAAGEGADSALGARSPSTGWLSGDVVQSRAPVAYEDAAADRGLLAADAVLASGYRAYLGVPLAGREGAVQGALAVYTADARAWREEEVEALGALAANASVALSNAELYQRVAVEREQSVAILSNIADGIVAVDREGNVVVWNAAAERITGVPAREALGRTTAQVLQRDLESESGATNRQVSIMRDGDEVFLALSEAIMRDPTGAVAGRIFAFRDISDERVVEQMKSDFVTTVSHELRTPLTSIYGFAETLLREDIQFREPERRTFLGYIASESERLTRIVDALLNVARLDTGDLTVSLEPIDVGTVVSEAVETLEDAAGANGHRFVVDLEGSLAAQADRDKLRQVLDQLVENAIKFSPDGGTVTVAARRRSDAVEVTVGDEGVGIPPSERERIFSKFHRAGAVRADGTGLGLFIAQGLVTAMGGRIQVESEEGRGSTFSFELPLARDE